MGDDADEDERPDPRGDDSTAEPTSAEDNGDRWDVGWTDPDSTAGEDALPRDEPGTESGDARERGTDSTTAGDEPGTDDDSHDGSASRTPGGPDYTPRGPKGSSGASRKTPAGASGRSPAGGDERSERADRPPTDRRGPARRPPLDEETIVEYTTDRRSLTPDVQLQWGFWTTIQVLILTAIATSALRFFGVDPRVGALILVGLFGVGMAWIAARYRRWVYQVRADALYLERGVVTHVRTLVPYVRIQHVDTSRGPIERALGLSTLVVYTAGSRGADVSIPGLTPSEASDLQQRVKELAIEAEGDDAL